MSLNNLVLLCNLYTVLVIKKIHYFTEKEFQSDEMSSFFGNMMCSSSWMKDDLTEFIRSLQPTSWLPHGSNWNPALLSDRRRSSSRKEERFLLPLPYFSFKKTNTGSWSSLRWDRFGLSDFASWLATNINMHVSRQRAWGEGVLCLIITIGS